MDFSYEGFSIPKFTEHVFKGKNHKYCLMIPLFNEGDNFIEQVKKMNKNQIAELVDIIILDAGSNDGTTDLDFLKKNNFSALLIREGKGRYSTDIRMGYYWALQRGYCGVITVDGNNKDDTSATIDFVRLLDKGYDYIQGSRYVSGGKAINTPWIRHWALKLINEPIMSYVAGQRLTDTTNGFRAYSSRILLDDNIQIFRDIFWGYELIYYLPICACKKGYNVIEIPVTRAYPADGKVPTKVGGIRGNIYQLSILWHIIKSDYDPK